jgi:hypothetical protein
MLTAPAPDSSVGQGIFNNAMSMLTNQPESQNSEEYSKFKALNNFTKYILR